MVWICRFMQKMAMSERLHKAFCLQTGAARFA